MNTIVDFRSYTTARGVPTLVFVDMQKEYLATPRLMAIPEIDEALANCRKLLAHARDNGLPVAFVRWLDRSGPFFNQATPFAGWIEGFEPQRNEMIFDRKRPSCYSSEGFAQFMEHGGKDVVLAGFTGESACLSTMVDAFIAAITSPMWRMPRQAIGWSKCPPRGALGSNENRQSLWRRCQDRRVDRGAYSVLSESGVSRA